MSPHRKGKGLTRVRPLRDADLSSVGCIDAHGDARGHSLASCPASGCRPHLTGRRGLTDHLRSTGNLRSTAPPRKRGRRPFNVLSENSWSDTAHGIRAAVFVTTRFPVGAWVNCAGAKSLSVSVSMGALCLDVSPPMLGVASSHHTAFASIQGSQPPGERPV